MSKQTIVISPVRDEDTLELVERRGGHLYEVVKSPNTFRNKVDPVSPKVGIRGTLNELIKDYPHVNFAADLSQTIGFHKGKPLGPTTPYPID